MMHIGHSYFNIHTTEYSLLITQILVLIVKKFLFSIKRERFSDIFDNYVFLK